MSKRVGVVGAGSWGTTVAHLCAHNQHTIIYSRRDEVASAINQHHENPRYLLKLPLHNQLRASSDLAQVISSADVVVMAVPAVGFRNTLTALRPYLRERTPVVSLSKGLEPVTNARMSEVINQELPDHPTAVLSGPNLAKEILSGDMAAAVIACKDATTAKTLQTVFSTTNFRVYTNNDIVGVEIAGVAKNIIAIALGIAEGLGAGNNARAALMTRGLAEITRLGVSLGGHQATFAGLAGMGDLLATSMSSQSRNRYVGEQLARGRCVTEISAEMDQVAEGVASVAGVLALAHKTGVEMPICAEVHACTQGTQTAADAYQELISRNFTCEWP